MIDSPTRILLVEDDEDDYVMTQEMIKDIPQFPYTLDWAYSYDMGTEALKNNAYDVALVDYNLGAKTGLDFLRESSNDIHPTPIIMLTGSGGELVAVEAMRQGALDYITKNLVSSKSLKRAISNALEKSELRKALESQRHILEETNKSLHAKNEEIQRFYHIVAHELKTPLTAGREFLALMLDGLTGPLGKEQREYVTLVQECFHDMTYLINDLLDVTRIETGKLSLYRQLTFLEPLALRVAAKMRPIAEKKGITLVNKIQSSLPAVKIDETRITQVLNNLISHALKFTGPGGSITVTIRQQQVNDSFIALSVQDTGCGIAASDLERIFDRLFQVQDTHDRQAGGLGLGLGISREVVKLHGGTLQVESQLGKGSIFSFNLPLDS